MHRCWLLSGAKEKAVLSGWEGYFLSPVNQRLASLILDEIQIDKSRLISKVEPAMGCYMRNW